MLCNATPNKVSRECLIGTVMRRVRSGIEHEATAGNQSSLWNKKVKDYRSSRRVCQRLSEAVQRSFLIRK